MDLRGDAADDETGPSSSAEGSATARAVDGDKDGKGHAREASAAKQQAQLEENALQLLSRLAKRPTLRVMVRVDHFAKKLLGRTKRSRAR